MRAGLTFLAGAWAGWIVAAAISVYGLGHLVHPYNASASFGMLATSAILPSGAIGVGAWLGARGTLLPTRRLVLSALGMGLLCTIVFFAGHAFGLGAVGAGFGILLVWLALPALAAFWTNRLARGRSSSPAP